MPLRRLPRASKSRPTKQFLEGLSVDPVAPLQTCKPSPALLAVLELMRLPNLAAEMASRPLPAGVNEVLRAAADRLWCEAASQRVGMSTDQLQLAARIYVKQVLLNDGADCYRVLGIQPDAPRQEARRHLGWLLGWLHPDHNNGWDSAFASRVVAGWQEVSRGGSPEGLRMERARSGNRLAKRPPRLRLRTARVSATRKKRSVRVRRTWVLIVATLVSVIVGAALMAGR
jgi:hypothetical protein